MNGFFLRLIKSFVAVAFALSITPLGTISAYAAENEDGLVAQEQAQTQTQTQEQEQEQEQELDADLSEQASVMSLKAGYVYFDDEDVEAGDTQQIAVVADDDSLAIASAELVYFDPLGEQIVLPSSAVAGPASLFQLETAYPGSYELTRVEGVLETGQCFEISLKAEASEPCAFEVAQPSISLFSMSANDDEASGEESSSVEEVSFYAMESDGSLLQTASIDEAASVSLSSAGASRSPKLVVALNPGHGGSDSGAVGADGLRESDVNWKIAQYCKSELENYNGVSVFITRSQNENPSLDERVERAKNAGAQVYVSLHINSEDSGSAHGAEVWYPNGSSYNNNVHVQGELLANKIAAQLESLGLTNRNKIAEKIRNTHNTTYPDGSTADYYGDIRYARLAGMPGIIVEHAFISNASECAKLRDESFLQRLGKADAAGIAEAFDLGQGGWEKQADGRWKYKLADDSYAKSQWRSIGEWYYFDSDGYALTGLQTIEGKKYLFSSSCARKTGWQKLEGEWCYFDPSEGDMKTDWTKVNAAWYYLDPSSGAMRSGWQKIKDKWYYLGGANDGSMKYGWIKMGSSWYYLGNADDGAMATGLTNVGGNTYYFGGADDGSMKSGWQKVEDKWYYLGGADDGSAKSGWARIGSWYYFDPATHAMATGLTNVGGNTYYFGGVDDGSMKSGWQKVEDKWYYLGGADDGSAKSGWAKLGSWYYFDPATHAMASGWQDVNDLRYYFGGADDGAMKSGWQKIEDKWYYLGGADDGSAKSGWAKLGSWYYFDPATHAMASGWQEVNDLWYYLGGADDGSMKSGWQKFDGKWYYLGGANDGSMKTGWQKDGGKWYYLEPSGAMVSGQYQVEGTWHYFASSGEWVGEGSPIMGASQVSVATMVDGYGKSGRTYPSDVLGNGGASTITEFCQIVYDEATAEGVRPEVLWAQIMNETGFLQFGGDVKIEQFNFGGIGATGNGAPGNSFPDVRTGIRAQVQHLKCYASTEPLKNARVDPRWWDALRGTAKTVQALGGKWATGSNYGIDLVNEYMTPYLGVH